MKLRQKITTFLWYDGKAEEAARFYCSLFKDSRIIDTVPGSDGNVLVVTFQLAGQEFIALNGGPLYKFTEAASLYVDCEDQREVDDLWARLLDGGHTQACGWLKDRYGLSWQIIPRALTQMLGDKDRARAARVMQAMLKMIKLDVATLQAAYDGR